MQSTKTPKQTLDEAKELLDAGYISREEFEELRQDILADLRQNRAGAFLSELQHHLEKIVPTIPNPISIPGRREIAKAQLDVLKLGKLLTTASQRLDTLSMPQRIILVRHGQSQGNVDDEVYQTIPDHNIELTQKGIQQARAAGKRLRELVKDESVKFFYSPYTRTRQTMEEIVTSGFSDKVHEIMAVPDSRLREQEFANFQDKKAILKSKAERGDYGRFYYRFANGESGADVYDRVTQAIRSIKHDMAENGHLKIKNIIIISHGLTMRLFLMRFLHWNVDQFENVWNPKNCAEWILERKDPFSARFTLASADVIFYGREKALGLPEQMMTVPLRQPKNFAELPPRRRLVLNKSEAGRPHVSVARYCFEHNCSTFCDQAYDPNVLSPQTRYNTAEILNGSSVTSKTKSTDHMQSVGKEGGNEQ